MKYVDPAQSYTDGRTEVQVISDILGILSGKYNPHFKTIVDDLLGYDSKIPIISRGYFKTENDLKRLRKEFSKMNLEPDTKRRVSEMFDKMNLDISDPQHPYFGLESKLTAPSDRENTHFTSQKHNNTNSSVDTVPNTTNGSVDKVSNTKNSPVESVSNAGSNKPCLPKSIVQATNIKTHFIQTQSILQTDEDNKKIIYLNWTSKNNNNNNNRQLLYLSTAYSHNNRSASSLNLPSCLDTGSNHLTISEEHLKEMKVDPSCLEERDTYTLMTSSTEKAKKGAVLGTIMLDIDIMAKTGQFHRVTTRVAVIKFKLPYALFDLKTCESLNYTLQHEKGHTQLFFQFPYDPPYCTKVDIQVSNEPQYNYQRQYIVNHQTYLEPKIKDTENWDYFDPEKFTIDDTELQEIVYSKNKLVHDIDDNAETSSRGYLKPNLDHCTTDQKEKLEKIFSQFESCFAKDQFSVGKFRDFQVDVDTVPGKTAFNRARKLDPDKIPAAENLLNGLVKSGVIAETTANDQFQCNMQVVPKAEIRFNSKGDKYIRKVFKEEESKTAKWRWILDLRSLNEILCNTQAITLSTIPEINSKLSDAQFIFKADFCNSFFNCEITPSTRHKLNFSFLGRTFQLTRLPMGLASSSYHQQRMFTCIFSLERLQKFKNEYKLQNFSPEAFKTKLSFYSDDCLIPSKSESEHYIDIMAFFFCCKDANIMVNLSKSSFFSRAFSFLNNSYSLESKSLGLNPQRIQSILAWKNPNCLALLSSFCSVLVYCGSHLPGIMLLCAPFFKMLRDKHFIFNQTYLRYFNNIKYMVALAIQLKIPDIHAPLLVTSDSSAVGGSANLLSYNNEIKEFELVATHSILYSKTLARRYILSKEANMCGYALKKFTPYLLQHKGFMAATTDVLCFLYMSTAKNKNSNINNIAILFSNFPRLNYLATSSESNYLSDLMSRLFTRSVKKGGNAHTKDLVFCNKNTKILNGKFLDSDTVMQLIMDDLEEKIECKEKRDLFMEYASQLSLKSLEQIFSQISHEKLWLMIPNHKAQLLKSEHLMWNKMLQKSKPNKSDLDKIDQKYKLSQLNLSSFIFFNFIQPKHTNLFSHLNETRKDTEMEVNQPTRPSDQSDQNQICPIFWPDQSELFLKHCVNIFKYLEKSPKISNLKIKIKDFHCLTLDEKYLLVQDCKSLIEEEFNIDLESLANFYIPIIYSIRETSEIKIEQGLNCLNVKLKNDTEFTGLKMLKLNVLIFSEAKFLYFEGQKGLQKCIYNQPSSININGHYFSTLYLFSPKKIKIAKDTIIYKICGFKTDLEISKLAHPVTVGCATNKEECTVDSDDTYTLINFEVVPNVVNNIFTEKIFLGFEKRFQFSNIFSNLVQIQTQYELPKYKYKDVTKNCNVLISNQMKLRPRKNRPKIQENGTKTAHNDFQDPLLEDMGTNIQGTPFTEPSDSILEDQNIEDQNIEAQILKDQTFEDSFDYPNGELLNTMEPPKVPPIDNPHMPINQLNCLVLINNLFQNRLSQQMLLKFLLSSQSYKNLYLEIQKFQKTKESTMYMGFKIEDFEILDSFIFLNKTCNKTNLKSKVLVTSPQLCSLIVNYYHMYMSFHCSIQVVRDLFNKLFFCPQLNKLTAQLEHQCMICLLNKFPIVHNQKDFNARSLTPSRPNETAIIDIMEQLPRAEGGESKLLLYQCLYSGYTAAVALKSNTSIEIAAALNTIFQYLQIPSCIIHDHAIYYQDKVAQLLARYNVKVFKRTVGRHEESGKIEQMVKVTKNYLVRMITNAEGVLRSRWTEVLPALLMQINNINYSKFPISRSTLFFGTRKFNNLSPEYEISGIEEDDIRDHNLAMNFLAKQQALRLIKSRKIQSRRFRVGNFVRYLVRNRDQKIAGTSRYLKSSVNQIFLITHVHCKSLTIRSLSTLATMTVPESTCRLLKFEEMQNLCINPSSFSSLLPQTRSTYPQRNSDFISPEQQTLHSLKISRQVQKILRDILEDTTPESLRVDTENDTNQMDSTVESENPRDPRDPRDPKDIGIFKTVITFDMDIVFENDKHLNLQSSLKKNQNKRKSRVKFGKDRIFHIWTNKDNENKFKLVYGKSHKDQDPENENLGKPQISDLFLYAGDLSQKEVRLHQSYLGVRF